MPVIPVSLISGTILDVEGDARQLCIVQFIPLSTPYVVDLDIVSTVVEQVTTDSSGYLEINLSYGAYRVIIADSDAFVINVPNDGLPHTLVSLIGTPLPVVSTGGGGNLVIDITALMNLLTDTGTIGFTRKGNPDADRTRFAVIGSYGNNSVNEGKVSSLVASWAPDAVIAAGDNNYPTGSSSTIDDNVGKYYHNFLDPYTGGYGSGAPNNNQFWPCPGDADWGAVVGGGATLVPYLTYFSFLGATYYTKTIGPCDFFFMDSDKNDPNGFTSTSAQATWLQAQLAASTAKWKIVVFHHTPYSSESGYTDTWMSDWNFALWGADVVITGHSKIYERIQKGSVTYLTVGTGGQTLGTVGAPVADSLKQYADDFGAMLIDANDYSLKIRFCNSLGIEIDAVELLSSDANKVYSYLKYNRNKGLKVGQNGLEVDFANVGFIKGLFQEAISQWANLPGGIQGSFVYIAYASDNIGTGFTTTFNSALNYIAFKVTSHPIASPSASDFTGLWKNYGGGSGGSAPPNYVVYLDSNSTAMASAGMEARATFQAAYDRAVVLATTFSAKVLIKVGLIKGSTFGNCALNSSWNADVEIEGYGENVSLLGQIQFSSVATDYTCNLTARNCTIGDIICASPTDAGTVDVVIVGRFLTIGDVTMTQTLGSDSMSVNLTGCTAAGAVFSGYPNGSSLSLVLNNCTIGAVSGEGTDVNAYNSIIGTLDSSFTDTDGTRTLGKGGNVSLDFCQCTSIKTKGSAWNNTSGGYNVQPPLNGGNVTLTNTSCGNIDASSINGSGGAVNISKTSNVGDILTSSNGNITSTSASLQKAGNVTTSDSICGNITASGNKGTGTTLSLVNCSLSSVVAQSTLGQGALLVVTRCVCLDLTVSGKGGGDVTITDSNVRNVTSSASALDGGDVSAIRSSLASVTTSTTSTTSGNGGKISLDTCDCLNVNSDSIDTSGLGSGGDITLIRSTIETIDYVSSNGAGFAGVLDFTGITFLGQLPVLRDGSRLVDCFIKSASGIVLTNVVGALVRIERCKLISGSGSYTISTSSGSPINIIVMFCAMNLGLHANLTNLIGTPNNVIDSDVS